MTFRGAIFDVDGVLVDSPHEAAWRDSLRELMEGEWADVAPDTTWTPDAFTSEVYQRVLSGKPRMSGARDALAHFRVPDLDRRTQEYADRKQAMIVRLIERGAFRAFDDALRFVRSVRELGIPTAAASSSKNAGLMLKKIQLADGLSLADALDVDISGRDFAHGKPAPDIFLAAARELGVPPEQAFVVEDAPSGVAAAKAGRMAALGVARADDAELLRTERADLVVTTLDRVDTAQLAEGRLRATE